jgi:hypothetical protein
MSEIGFYCLHTGNDFHRGGLTILYSISNRACRPVSLQFADWRILFMANTKDSFRSPLSMDAFDQQTVVKYMD